MSIVFFSFIDVVTLVTILVWKKSYYIEFLREMELYRTKIMIMIDVMGKHAKFWKYFCIYEY